MIASEPYYPGWSATAAGRPLPVRRIGYLTAISVPVGVTTVVLSYFLPGLILAAIISMLTLLILIAISVPGLHRRVGRLF